MAKFGSKSYRIQTEACNIWLVERIFCQTFNCLCKIWRKTEFSPLNAPGVYFKLSQLNPAFIRGRRLIGARRLLTECNFLSFSQVDF